jgi:hypothetical protein
VKIRVIRGLKQKGGNTMKLKFFTINAILKTNKTSENNNDSRRTK